MSRTYMLAGRPVITHTRKPWASLSRLERRRKRKAARHSRRRNRS